MIKKRKQTKTHDPEETDATDALLPRRDRSIVIALHSLEANGGPARIRTLDQGIMSPLL